MKEWRADHSEVQNFLLPLVCSQTFMIQEEQRESCVTHDHALVHTAFSFYSHQKCRIKYFLVKKKKKIGNIAPFWNVRAEVSVASSFRFCCAVPSRSVQGNLHRLFDLGFKS